MVTKKKL